MTHTERTHQRKNAEGAPRTLVILSDVHGYTWRIYTPEGLEVAAPDESRQTTYRTAHLAYLAGMRCLSTLAQ